MKQSGQRFVSWERELRQRELIPDVCRSIIGEAACVNPPQFRPPNALARPFLLPVSSSDRIRALLNYHTEPGPTPLSFI